MSFNEEFLNKFDSNQSPEFSLKDEEVLWASQKKPALFKILVDRYEAAFLRKAQSIIGNPQEAEDIVQEALVKIYFNASKFKKQEGIEFKSWAYRVLMNVAITKYRRLKKATIVEFLDPLLYEEIPDSSDFTAALDNKVAAANLMAKLPETMKRLMTLYYLEDRSYKEIAETEGLTIPALKMKLFRAKRLLRKLNKND